MNWFKHDSDATTDYKLKKLIMKYGTDGYAIYFHCLELIAGSISDTNITFELEHDAEIIADDLKVKGTQTQSAVDRVNEIMLYMLELKLFESSGDRIFCFKMLNRLDCSMTSNPRLRKMIAEAKESHDLVMTHHDSIMLEEKRREEIRREDNRREESTVPATPSPPSLDSSDKPTLFDESGNAKEGIKDTVPPAKVLPDEAIRLAHLLADLHRNLTDAKFHPKDSAILTWAGDIDKLNRIDGREWGEIEGVIRWVQTPGCFWNPNILSGKTLREKFDRLVAQMKQGSGGQGLRNAAKSNIYNLQVE